jgi:hypothetical protein
MSILAWLGGMRSTSAPLSLNGMTIVCALPVCRPRPCRQTPPARKGGLVHQRVYITATAHAPGSVCTSYDDQCSVVTRTAYGFYPGDRRARRHRGAHEVPGGQHPSRFWHPTGSTLLYGGGREAWYHGQTKLICTPGGGAAVTYLRHGLVWVSTAGRVGRILSRRLCRRLTLSLASLG